MTELESRMSVEELTMSITKNIQYLEKCTDFASREAKDVANKITGIWHSILNQPDMQKAAAKHLATLNLGKLFTDIWQSLSGFIKQTESQGFASLCAMMAMYCCITDLADEVSKEMGESGCLEIMIQAMDKYRQDYNRPPFTNILVILSNAIQNCTTNISIYRKAKAIPIFKQYLDVEDKVAKMRSVVILAHIVGEEDNSLLQTVNDGVGFLLSLVEEAISSTDHRAADVNSSALELLMWLNKLAVNDNNKREIVKLGGIPVFTRMLSSDFSEEERCAAVQALQMLSFIEEVRTSKELQESVKVLENLEMSPNQDLQQEAARTVWQIKDYRLNRQYSAEAQSSYKEAITQPSKPSKVQVMISYQWDNQETTKKLRDLLVKAGYQVWMDITHMRGSLLDAMAKAVETSSLVLICMSEKYKNSENCRLEAQYAHRLKKPIVPLLLEPDYTPDGWLGMIGLTKLYTTVTSNEKLDSTMTSIFAEIQQALGGSDDDDGPIRPSKQEETALAAKSSKPPVRNWTSEDVKEWLTTNNLSRFCETFKTFKGRHLENMHWRYTKDWVAFYKVLASDYQMTNDKTRTEFVVALEEALER